MLQLAFLIMTGLFILGALIDSIVVLQDRMPMLSWSVSLVCWLGWVSAVYLR